MKPAMLMSMTFWTLTLMSWLPSAAARAQGLSATNSPAATPVFQTAGQSFAYTSACTPDALSLTLSVSNNQLSLTYGYVSGDSSQDYTFAIPTHQMVIVWQQKDPNTNTTQVIATKSLTSNDGASYTAALVKFKQAVTSIEAGNGRCNQAHPELADIVGYLDGLVSVN